MTTYPVLSDFRDEGGSSVVEGSGRLVHTEDIFEIHDVARYVASPVNDAGGMMEVRVHFFSSRIADGMKERTENITE